MDAFKIGLIGMGVLLVGFAATAFISENKEPNYKTYYDARPIADITTDHTNDRAESSSDPRLYKLLFPPSTGGKKSRRKTKSKRKSNSR
jgi:hypothetical protein